MKKLVLALALFASVARAEAVISIPSQGPTLTRMWEIFEIPVTVSNFTNPTGLGAKWVEVNVLPSYGLTVLHYVPIGPWTISGNPTNYYGWHNYYVDLWHMTAGLINPVAPCITAEGGVAFSLRIQVNQYWTGGQESIQLGRSIKEAGPEPRLLDCAGAYLPIRYGNATCVFPVPQPVTGDPGGTCHSVNCETAATTTVKTTWGRVKAMYR